ncbi:MAG: hypothetical protein ABSA96_16960 [Candidatus Acidiferrales bacterium]|jgi:hypothetical protein
MVIFLALIWYGLRFLNGMSVVAPTRAEVIAWNLADFGTLALFFLGVSLDRLKSASVFTVRGKADRTAFHLLGVWMAAVVLGVLVGILRGNPWDYLIGDLYRYACLPVVLALFYYAVKNDAGVHDLLAGFVVVYGLMTALDLVRFNSYDERLTTETAHQAGIIAPAVIYLMLFDNRRWARRCGGTAVFLIVVLLVRAQMITPIVTLLLALALFFIFNRKFTLFGGIGMAITILAGAWFFYWVASADASYIATKFVMAQGSEGALGSVEALSGVRLGEIISIGEEFRSHPSTFVFGTGQGSLVSPDPIPDLSLPIYRYTEDKHFIHSGLFDALYHNGAIAVGAFLLLLVHLFRRGWHLHSAGITFGLFVVVTLMVTLLLLSYDLPLESSFPLLGVCLSGVSLMERRLHGVAKPMPGHHPRHRLDPGRANGIAATT